MRVGVARVEAPGSLTNIIQCLTITNIICSPLYSHLILTPLALRETASSSSLSR